MENLRDVSLVVLVVVSTLKMETVLQKTGPSNDERRRGLHIQRKEEGMDGLVEERY
jgi:hypothetical protein